MPQNSRPSETEVLSVMENWPKSWAGTQDDEVIGRDLVRVLSGFMSDLQEQGLSSKTFRRHLDNLWLLGGEVVRRLQEEPSQRDAPARVLLLDAIEGGEALLIRDLTETEQGAVDGTARKLLKYLTAPNRKPRP